MNREELNVLYESTLWAKGKPQDGSVARYSCKTVRELIEYIWELEGW